MLADWNTMPLPEIADFPDRYQFRFCPLCGTPLEECTRHGRTRLVCPNDGWTFFPNPNVAATVVVEYQGGIVLLRRAIPPDKGIWHLPIGHLEFGESPEEAALREASEETGLVLEDPVFLDFEHSPSYGDAAMFYIVFCYRARATGGELRVDHENSDIRVAPPDELPELKWSSQRRALAEWYRWRTKKI